MLIVFSLFQQASSWTTIHADRLIQYQKNSSINEFFGSTRSNLDHSIRFSGSEPSSSNAVFLRLDKTSETEVSEYLNASSPIVFLVPNSAFKAEWLTPLLIGSNHKSPIYFAFNQDTIPQGYSSVLSTDHPSNSAIKKTKLQNVIGTINNSITYDRERVVLITAPFDSFSLIPTSNNCGNTNGLALTVLLETMRQLSSYPITNNWAFVFALVDGHFCNSAGLERFVSKIAKEHGPKIEFAISLESLSSPSLKGTFGLRLRRDSAFAKFMLCFIDSLKSAGIPFATKLATNEQQELDLEPKWTDALPPHGSTEEVFTAHTLPSIAISGGEQVCGLDGPADEVRAKNFAWALTEALFRMMYGADSAAEISERENFNTEWLRISEQPRMPAYRDNSLAQSIEHWMAKFGRAYVDEWSSIKCYAPSAATDANLVLYNPTSGMKTVILFIAAVVYGFAVFAVVGGKERILKLIS